MKLLRLNQKTNIFTPATFSSYAVSKPAPEQSTAGISQIRSCLHNQKNMTLSRKRALNHEQLLPHLSNPALLAHTPPPHLRIVLEQLCGLLSFRERLEREATGMGMYLLFLGLVL